jgi:hypothetical protein
VDIWTYQPRILAYQATGWYNGLMTKLSPSEAGYIAGILDGEGTLSMSYYKGAVDSYGRKYRSFSLTCRVTNTSKALIEWLVKTSGYGKIKLLPIPPSRTGFPYKPQWSWLLSANGCRDILPHIYPHLIIKKRQAEIFIDWFKNISGKRGKRMNDNVFQYKLKILKELHTLNKKGL